MAITFKILSVTDLVIDGMNKQQASFVTWDAGPAYYLSQTAAFAFQGNEAAVQTFLEANAQFYYDDAVAGNSVIPSGLLNRLDWLPTVAPLKTARMNQLSAFNGWSGLTAGEQTQLLNKLNDLRQLFYDILKAP
jgi:hypothetical protein